MVDALRPRQLVGHEEPVLEVAFSSDGNRVVSGGGDYASTEPKDCSVRLWDFGTGAMLGRFDGNKSVIWEVAVSNDGNWIASTAADRAIVWNVTTGSGVTLLNGSDVVAISADGRQVAVYGDDAWVAISHHPAVLLYKIHSDGSTDTIATAANLEQEKVTFYLEGEATRVLTIGPDGTGKIWDLGTGSVLQNAIVPGGSVSVLAVTRDLSKALLSVDSGGAVLRDLMAEKDVFHIDEKVRPGGAFSGNAQRYLCIGEHDGIDLWDMASGVKVCSFQIPGQSVAGLDISPDGLRAVTCSYYDKTVHLWDLPE
jgi:WD40 repeat protein